MFDFKLDENGDVIIQDNDIQTCSNGELLAQQIKMILNTNCGEWWLDENEGIPFKEILVKSPDYAAIEEYIKYAVKQIDDSIEISNFSHELTNRVLTIKFTANGEEAALTFAS